MNTTISDERRRSIDDGSANDLPDGDYFTADFVKTAGQDGFGLGLRTNEEGNVEVYEILEGSPASVSLINRGDIIIGIQNEFVLRKHKRELRTIIKAIPNGQRVLFHMCRQSRGRTRSLAVEKKSDFFGQLHEAIEIDDVDLVSHLINEHEEHKVKLLINCPFHPLHKALAEGHNSVATYFITNRLVDLNGYSEKYTGSPLTLAARHNRGDQAKLLIDMGVNTNDTLSSPSSPLHTAISCGNEAIAKLLATKHKELTDPQSPAYSLLFYLAVSYARLELVKHWWRPEIKVNEAIDDGAYTSPAANGITRNKLLLIPAFRNASKAPKGEGKKYRAIIKFLLSKGAMISLPVVEVCGKPTLDYLRHGQKEFPNKVEWSAKSLSHLSFDKWLKPYCTQIVILDLSGNPLKEIPATVPWRISTIEKFVVSNCESLEVLSPPQSSYSVPMCDRLYIVKISNNAKLQSIAVQYFQLKSLTELNLKNNQFFSLPGENELEPWKCERLEILNLAGNKLASLPTNIAHARNLRKLLVSGNLIGDFPPPWPCPLLELDLSGNLLKSLPTGFRKHWNNSLQLVNLSDNELEDFATDICEMERLTFLDMSCNKIKDLPHPEIWRCKRLIQLNLANNLLGTPLTPKRTSSFSSSVNLNKFLRMRRNSETQPTSPTKTAFQTRKLSVANKSTGALSDMIASSSDILFPIVFAEKLTNLDLSHNKFTSVPIGVSSLTALCVLNISHNSGITQLPQTIGQMMNLQTLEMTGLDLKMLPDKFNP
uniref:PDZ domain-containing protein n=1 Tax=Plectus sambesii TaxID=2011161 RepID=A0A914WEZ8_9BILA